MTHPPGNPGGGGGGSSGGGTTGPGRTSDLATFEFPATGQAIRTLVVDGEPWFVAADIARELGYRMASDMTRRLDQDDRGTRPVRTPSGEQEMTVISEAGLYAAILGSQTQRARDFKRWVTHDVLPAIRRTGRYEVAQIDDPLTELELANERSMRAVAIAKDERLRRQAAEQQLAIAAPKAEAWETLASADGDFSVADAAKILARDPQIRLGERRLFTLLWQWGWIYRQGVDQRWRVYQAQIETGRLSEIPQSHYHPRNGELVLDPPQVRVTVKGIEEIRRRLTGQLAIGGVR